MRAEASGCSRTPRLWGAGSGLQGRDGTLGATDRVFMPVFPSLVFLRRRGTRRQDTEPAAGVGLGEQTHREWLTQERG